MWRWIVLCLSLGLAASNEVTEAAETKVVELGDTVTLTCVVQSGKTDTVTWRDVSQPNPITVGEFVFVGDDRYSISKERTQTDDTTWNLHIQDVQPVHAGMYECMSTAKKDVVRRVSLQVRGDDKSQGRGMREIYMTGTRYVEKGMPIKVNCTSSSKNVDWYKDGIKLRKDERTTMKSVHKQKTVHTLEIKHSTLSDSGTIVCRASLIHIASLKVVVLNADTVNMKRGPSKEQIPQAGFSTEAESKVVEQGDDVTLPCVVQSGGTHTISWESGKAGLLTNDEFRVIKDDRFSVRQEHVGDWSLHIKEVRLEDDDTYDCVINTDPPLVKQVTLIVGYPADAKASRKRLVRQKGRRGKLECFVTGKPGPATVWMKGDKEVKADSRHLIDLIDKGEYNSVMRLKIKKLKPSDFGDYECRVNNTLGSSSGAIRLVEAKQSVPMFDAKTENVSAKPGSMVALPCSVDSLGNHKVLWLRSDQTMLTLADRRLIDNDRLHVERSMKNSWDLVISDATEADAGVYICQVNTKPPVSKTVTLAVGHPPVATIANMSASVTLRDSMMLACFIEGYPRDFMMWTLNSTDIPIGNKYKIDAEDVSNVTSILTLRINDVRRKDLGLYVCRASNHFGATQDTVDVTEMEVSDELRFEDTPNNITVEPGTDVVLPCSVLNLKDEKVMWIYGKSYLSMGEEMTIRDSRIRLQREGGAWNLQIKDVSFRDAGIYRCRVGMDTPMLRTVFLNVEDADDTSGLPSLMATASNVTVVKGTTAVLPCSVVRLGRHQVAWVSPTSHLLAFRTRRIFDDERISVKKPHYQDWNLHIQNVNEKDEGEYLCQINTMPISKKSVYLFVQYPAEILEPQSSDVVVEEKEEVELVCNVTGDPIPQVTWRRKDNAAYCDGTQFSGDLGEILRIPSAATDCSGAYECIAYNGIPPAVRLTMTLTVGVGPKVLLSAEMISQRRGKDTMLECVILMSPFEAYAWFREGMEIKDGPRYELELSEDDDESFVLSLLISDIEEEDFGNYTCSASNAFGYAESSVLLQEMKAPLPVITTTENITAIAGDSVVLECTVDHLEGRTVQWVRNDTGVVISEGADILEEDSERYGVQNPESDKWNLVIGRVMSSDSGTYTCQVAIQDGIVGGELELFVAVPTSFASLNEVADVKEGDQVTLECNAEGFPTPNISWTVPEKAECSVFDSESGKSLKIQDIQRDCSGDYICAAYNGYGEAASKRVTLNVKHAPDVSVEAEMMTQEIGLDTMLECRAASIPEAVLYWYRGGNRIEHDAKFKAVMENEEGLSRLTLEIRRLQKEDFGEYTCKAMNEIGSAESTVTLYSPAVVKAEESSADAVVRRGDSMTLMCEAVGVPEPDITWFKLREASGDTYQEEPEQDYVGEGPQLLFESVSNDDQGTYKCVANNGYDSTVNSNHKLISVSVEYTPTIKMLPVEVDDENGEATLRCRVTAFPQGYSMWKKNGVEIQNSEKHRVDLIYVGNNTIELKLVIPKLGNDPYYYYTCVASNLIGEARKEVMVKGVTKTLSLDEVTTEPAIDLEETTREEILALPDETGTRVHKHPKKDRDGKKTKTKKHKHKKGKKHKKDKHRKGSSEDESSHIHVIHREEKEREDNTVDVVDKQVDQNENRVETPYRSAAEEERSAETRRKGIGGTTQLSYSVYTLLCVIATYFLIKHGQ